MDKKNLSPLLATGALDSDEISYLVAMGTYERPTKVHFALDPVSDGDTFSWFRFTREDMHRLFAALRFPEVVR